MITFYIEAFYPDGSPLLGTGDGQDVTRKPMRQPQRWAAWKRAQQFHSPRVGEYRLIRVLGNPYGPGQIIATVRK